MHHGNSDERIFLAPGPIAEKLLVTETSLAFTSPVNAARNYSERNNDPESDALLSRLLLLKLSAGCRAVGREI